MYGRISYTECLPLLVNHGCYMGYVSGSYKSRFLYPNFNNKETFMINNIEERIKEYSEMIKKYPGVKEFHIERAKLYCEIREYEKAVEDFKKTLEGYYVCQKIARVCEESGFNRDAEYYYTKAINKDKNNVNNYIDRLYFYMRIREIEKAISDCKAILKLSPKDKTLLALKNILTGK